jgi:hypothetical protein
MGGDARALGTGGSLRTTSEGIVPSIGIDKPVETEEEAAIRC